MKVTSFLACLYGNYTADGLVDLGGIGWDSIQAGSLPVRINLKFFIRCESELSDLPGPHKAELVFIGEDKVLSRNTGEFVTTEEKRNQHLLVDMGMRFDSEGHYRVDVLIDGKLGASWPLQIHLVSDQPPSPA